MVYQQKKEEIVKKTKKVMSLIEKRGHDYIDGSYQNRSSILVIWCPIHGNEYKTTFYNYERSLTGCLCCGRAQVSTKLKSRLFSQDTIDKMSISARIRPERLGGKPRRWRETHSYRKWRAEVLKIYNYQCAITGKKQTTKNLVVHHLYGTTVYPHLVYHIKNGIVLHKEYHLLFYKKYGYGLNTLEQFLDFLFFISQLQKSKLISCQGELENSQGSETRVYDPERVMKLHEHLKETTYF
jgi:hypothetical protein